MMLWRMNQTKPPRTTSTMPVELIDINEANLDHRHEWKFMKEATKDVKVQLHATLKLEATRFTMKVNQRTTRIKMPSPALQIGRHVRRDVVDEVEGGARGVPTVASGTRPDQT